MTGFINYEEMFAQSIGLKEPWYVERAEFEEDSKEVHIYVKAKKTSKNPCPECGEMLEFAEGCVVCKSCGYSKCF